MEAVLIKLDLVGQRFGRLLVTCKAGSVNQKVVWNCLCDCGNATQVPSAMLRSGNTSSCGCLGIEARSRAVSISNRTHGKSKTATYEVWFNMKRRCESPKHKSYKDYGGRGIAVCGRWQKFEGFLADMGEAQAGMSIDRINVNGNYEPGNCRWSTIKEQQNNRRSNVLLTYFGETKTRQQWAEDSRCAVSAAAFVKRIEAGWPIEKALTRPARAFTRKGDCA